MEQTIKMDFEYDVIVVGAGHAGCEAACAAARMGSKTLLITMDMARMGQMSCNPAMGGVAKGQIVREIDALGGQSGAVSDRSAIQFRMLNRSKGPAMWSPRTQNDRVLFTLVWREILENTPGLSFYQDMVASLIVENNRVGGVVTQTGVRFRAKAVVLTNGTFLNGLIHIGEKNFGGGRMSEGAAKGITEQLVSLGFESGRMKTGTPPRVDGRSLDYTKMEEQKGDEKPAKFSFLPESLPLAKQRSCYITYTNLAVHDLLKEGFDKSPMYSGRIQGLGPRYCPSIEDKISRFADKERHQIFVEPEGWDTVEIYVNGFSTSLPFETQIKALKQIAGFENAKIFRPGYAIEYDYFPPHQLLNTLETKGIENLYFAGQINGTTGYEEAACQGLMAGINAHLRVKEKDPFVLKRDEAYIGVLIDDLVTKGTQEPYRMFTSRAEYRILLRQDNADLRLTPLGYKVGLATSERLKHVEYKKGQIEEVRSVLEKTWAEPEEVNGLLEQNSSSLLSKKTKLHGLLLRPQVSIYELIDRIGGLAEKKDSIAVPFREEVLEEAELLVKYEGYIKNEVEMAEKMKRLENVPLDKNFDYHRVHSLSSESREKLIKIRPSTLGQASRISGVSPSDISVLLIHLGR